MSLTSFEQKLVAATESGLPLSTTPFFDLAKKLDCEEQEVLHTITDLQTRGVIRRVAAVPNHYQIGYKFNAMTVWDVDDSHISALGKVVGALDVVTHCYKRPRHLPIWPYNLFAMVHGQSKQEAIEKATQIEQILKPHLRSFDILFSTRILKKTGFRTTKR